MNMKHAVKDSWFRKISVHSIFSKLRPGPKWPLFSNGLTYNYMYLIPIHKNTCYTVKLQSCPFQYTYTTMPFNPSVTQILSWTHYTSVPFRNTLTLLCPLIHFSVPFFLMPWPFRVDLPPSRPSQLLACTSYQFLALVEWSWIQYLPIIIAIRISTFLFVSFLCVSI